MISKGTSVSRGRVKSGCRTCKIRKVKCDESRPACIRCESTGRTCDGYGIWGGGSQQTAASKLVMKIARPPCVSLLVSCDSEKISLEWFYCRTATKLSGTYESEFWQSILPQTSMSEIAVLQAVLALSTFHKQGSSNNIQGTGIDSENSAVLRYSVKAMSELVPHFKRRDRLSVRVTLITCYVFICLDFLRGHPTTALMHLQHGLNIIEDMQNSRRRTAQNDGIQVSDNIVDGWIINAYCRLRLQVEILLPSFYRYNRIRQPSNHKMPTLMFDSFRATWDRLEWLLNFTIEITNKATHGNLDSQHTFFDLRESREYILLELQWWRESYDKYISESRENKFKAYKQAYQLPIVYHSMAIVMAKTCLRAHDETVFDNATSEFASLLSELIKLLKVSLSVDPSITADDRSADISHSIVDLGWIVPLYFTALNCRVPRIRIHAIRLLETMTHREGLWDSTITACVARKVMELEGHDVYESFSMVNNFELLAVPLPHELQVPAKSEVQRLHNVEALFDGSPMTTITLVCADSRDNYKSRLAVAKYNLKTQTWTNLQNILELSI